MVAVATGWAMSQDPSPTGRQRPPDDPGLIARIWAVIKLGVVGLLSPIWAPAIMLRASTNNQRARRLTAEFPEQVRSIARGAAPEPPGNQVVDISSEQRLVVFSDLHRCIPGRIDWARRQHTKSLYASVLQHYADSEWTLCENGDIEDYWMVGGSAYGAVYDALRILGGGLARYGWNDLLVELYRSHLDAIIANNSETYSIIRDGFARAGRYVRTVGNHDNPNSLPTVSDRLHFHLGIFPIGDYVAMRSRSGQLIGVITHGHHTDAWNAPSRDNLGKLSTWVAGTLVDVPKMRAPEGLPPREATDLLISGRMPDRLITVNPVFGANSSYDSLDEELLFDTVVAAGFEDLWVLMGHTHSPVASPVSRNGEIWTRYLNSGCGIIDGAITAIEWDGSGDEPLARLVAWSEVRADSEASNIVTLPDGRRLVRTVFEPHGDRLVPTSDPEVVEQRS